MAVEKKHIEFLKILADTAIRMTEGQMLELINTHNWSITRREYMGIITSKTADLLSAACASGGIVAGAKKDDIESLRNFGLNMGIAFQIVDDVFDRLEHLFKNGNALDKDYLRIIELVQDNGAINKCLKDAQDYADLAETYLGPFPDSPIKESLLKLNQFIVDRSY